MYNQIKHFQNLNVRLDEIETFIKLIEAQKKLSAEYMHISNKSIIPLDNLDNYLAYAQTLNNSMVQYNAVIISIYACFENYVDKLCKSYIELFFDNTSEFNDFPNKTVKNYFKQVGEYLSNPQRYSGLELSPEKIITCLYENINNNRSIPLQYEFILNHGGNLKIDKITDLFLNIGITEPRSKLQNNYILQKYMSEAKDIPISDISKFLATLTTTYFELDRLVDARNSVAHGWNEDARIAYSSILTDTIPFIKCLSNVLLEITLTESYDLFLKNDKLNKYDSPINVIDNKILCINTKTSKIKTKDYIFYTDTQSKPHIAQVNTLQINGQPLEESAENNIDIGIGLDRPVKITYQFYYI